ncbi:MAG TPA: hypothetical protein DIC23_17230, partial [Planctomycetaceae bacterium]|nr:hypothetical protein [Planctomycetaceae bacterium]
MADEPKIDDPGELSNEESSQESVVDDVPVVRNSRGIRLLRRSAVFFLAVWAIVEISSPLCSGYSLGALESAYDASGKKGLTLKAAQGHAVGLAMMSFRVEKAERKGQRSVQFAVFRWPSVFRSYSFEVEVEKVKKAGDTEGVIVVRSQPYIFQEKIVYPVVQPKAERDSPQMQLMMLDHETDSVGTHRVERWQVERAVKNKGSDVIPHDVLPSLLEFFDKSDKNKDGVVTAGELGMQEGIGPSEADKSKSKSKS